MAKYKIIPSSRTIVQLPISIGHKAEKGVEAIEFDVTAWVETYGSGTLTVIMRRWGDAIPYPIALEIDENNKAVWTLSNTDTAKAGMAYAQLNYIVGDEVVKKSDIYTFRVMDSLTGEGEPPEAYESWLEHLTHLAAEAMAEVLDIEGIVTDKTLTVDGGIADAKATGEALAKKVDAADYSELSDRVGRNTIALAEKADRSTTYTKAQVNQMISDVEVETDTTLAISGAAADAAETGRQIGLIKADLDALDNKVLNDNIKVALLNCIYHIGAWSDSHAEDYYNTLHNAFYPSYGVFLGKTIDNNTGKFFENSLRMASEFIPIDKTGFSAEISNPNIYIGFRGYDENKEYLGDGLGGMNTPVASGEWNQSVKYIKMLAKKSDNSAFTSSDVTGVSLTINGIEKSLSVKKSFYAMNFGKGISPTTGETYDASNRMCSDYISVSNTSFTAEISNPNIYIGFRAYGTGLSYITPAEGIGSMDSSSVSGTWSSAVKAVKMIAKKRDNSQFTQADIDGFTLTINGDTRAMQ